MQDVPSDLSGRPENRLLGALLQACPELEASLSTRAEKAGTELYHEGGPIPDVYFPTRGVLSVVVRLSNGEMAEVQTIGNEGMAGLPAWLEIPLSSETVLQQAPGELVAISVAAFNAAAQHSKRAERLLDGYAAYSMRFGSQTCVCNAHHSLTQRLCRWLLTSVDRAGAREIALTQSMLAEMLGARRQSVGDILVGLSRAGTIEQQRNRIVVLGMAELERLSCECYRTTKSLYGWLVEPLL